MNANECDIAKKRLALLNKKPEWSNDEILEAQLLKDEIVNYVLTHLPADGTDRKIVELLKAGKLSKEIGQAIFLSERTVENRVQKLMKVYKAKNRAHLVAIINDAEKD